MIAARPVQAIGAAKNDASHSGPARAGTEKKGEC